jgi:hypothetical protein
MQTRIGVLSEQLCSKQGACINKPKPDASVDSAFGVFYLHSCTNNPAAEGCVIVGNADISITANQATI